MKKITAVLLSITMFTGCSQTEPLDRPSTDDHVQTTINNASLTEESISASITTTADLSAFSETVTSFDNNVKDNQRRVKVVKYENEQLTYEYEDKLVTNSLPVSILDDINYGNGPTLAERIINNRFREIIYADIMLNSKDDIIYCDVYTPNEIENCTNDSIVNRLHSGLNLEQTEMTLNRVGGSRVELSNEYITLEADLNDLDNLYKGHIPDNAERIAFKGIRFKNGELMLTMIMVFDHYEDSPGGPCPQYKAYDCKEKYSYFGTVISCTEDRAIVLLNDGVTTCDVPTYYNDGEIEESAKVMITLDADPSIFGSGNHFISEYAVFYTCPEKCMLGGNYDFSKLAYAIPDKTDPIKFICTLIDKEKTLYQ